MRFVTRGLFVVFAAALLACGCLGQPVTGGKKAAPGAGKGHAHPDLGPHGGALAEWGEEEYHAEFTVDHAKKQATVYILDGNIKKAAPIAAESITLTITNVQPPVQVNLKADPQEGDPKDSASRFAGTHDQLGKEMEFKGEISGKVGDKPFTGTFEEKEHDHKHEKK